MSESFSNEATPASGHRTVARVMSILELVVASEPQGLRLGDLAGSLSAPKSSVHGLAKGLVATGYFREQDGRYFLGPAISSILAANSSAHLSICRPLLEKLARTWDETAMLANLVGDSIVYVDAVEAEAFIRASPNLNQRLSLWPRSSGKCFLAYMEPRRLEAYLRKSKDAPADNSSLRDELDSIRDSRVAFNIGQSVADNLGIASPIFFDKGPATLALAISGPRARMEDRLDEMAESLRDAAQSISNR